MRVRKIEKPLTSVQLNITLPASALVNGAAVGETISQSFGKDVYTTYVYVRRDSWSTKIWELVLEEALVKFGKVIYTGPYITGFKCQPTSESNLEATYSEVVKFFAKFKK